MPQAATQAAAQALYQSPVAILEAYLFDGFLAHPKSYSGDCYSAPEADAHDDAPAAPTPTPTATSPTDSHDEDLLSDSDCECV